MAVSIYPNQILAYSGGNITRTLATTINSQVDIDTRRVLQSDFPATTATGVTYSCTFVGLLFGGDDWPGIENLLAPGDAPANGLFAVVRTKRDGALVWTNPGIVGKELSYELNGYITAAARVEQSGLVYRCEAKQLSSSSVSVNVDGAAFVVASHDFAPGASTLTVGGRTVDVSAGMGVTQIAGVTSGSLSGTYEPTAGSLWLLGGTEATNVGR